MLLVVVVALTLLIDFSGISWRMEQMVTDTVSSLIKPVPASDIAIVAIDEKSLRKYGRWPWSRRLHARLLDRLRQAKSGPVAFDVLFADANGSDPAGDGLFATAIAAHGKVVLAMSSDEDPGDGEVTEVLPYAVFPMWRPLSGIRTWPSTATGLCAAPTCSPAPAPHAGRILPLLPYTFPENSGSWIFRERPLLPSSRDTGALGQEQQVYSFTDVVEGMIDSEKLAGKTLFVGITAAAIRRTFSIPDMASGVMSGVEIHANTFNALKRT